MQAQDKQLKLGDRFRQLLQEVDRMTADRRSRLLIIESNRNVRTMFELAFSYNGGSYQVYTAPSGRSALLQFGIVRPDIILLDVDMPDDDGWLTLERLRELTTVPIVAVSEVNSPETLVRSLEEGADHCLTKPFGLRELHARVRALLRRESAKGQNNGRTQPGQDTLWPRRQGVGRLAGLAPADERIAPLASDHELQPESATPVTNL